MIIKKTVTPRLSRAPHAAGDRQPLRIGNAHVHPGGRPLSLLLSTLADALRLVIADAVDHAVDAARVQLCTQLYCTAVLYSCTRGFLMGPRF